VILNASGCLDALEAPEVARSKNGGTQGSPVGPLLHTSDSQPPPGLPPGKARLRPATVTSSSVLGGQRDP
jgi:hypothetical protein